MSYFINLAEATVTTKDQINLLRAYHVGKDLKARERLAEYNTRYVCFKIRQFANTGIDYEDLFSIGCIGMMKAIDTFDLNKEIQWTTYLDICIRNEILMYIRRNKKYVGILSLDFSYSEDNDHPITMKEYLQDGTNIEDEIIDKDTYDSIRQLFKHLTMQEKKILYLRFLCENPLNQKEVGDSLQLSQSVISRKEKSCLQRLRNIIEWRDKIDKVTR